mgnify:CR=1 FL=1
MKPNHDSSKPAPKQTEARTEATARRPYQRPTVSTFPLFERMALVCDDKDFEFNQS